MRRDQPGRGIVTWAGQQDAISRLVLGFAPELLTVMENCGIDDATRNAVRAGMGAYEQSLISPPMPIQDAIDVAEFLVDLTSRYVRFIPGAPLVGGPVEVACITKHEGFKWIKRKHFYTAELNQATGDRTYERKRFHIKRRRKQ